MPKIVWKKGDFDSELGEFERTLKEYYSEKESKDPKVVKELKKMYQKSAIVPLSNSDWSKMINTDSYSTDSMAKIEYALKSNGTKRDLCRILYQFAECNVLAPIAVRLGNKKLYCVAGNTRLMIARTLDIIPSIVIIDTDW